MATGTAILIVGIVYLLLAHEGFRMFALMLLGLFAGVVWFLIDFGQDKPQTLFYNHSAHPAFLMKAGDSCPEDRHVWNGWCVK